MTDVVRVDAEHPDAAIIASAAAALRDGALVAFPTETVYGLGVNALDREALKRLFLAKGRPSTDPLIVHVAGIDAVGPLVRNVPSLARHLAEAFWPGPLTLVLHRSVAVPDEVTATLDTIGIRAPAHPVARALVAAAAIPIAAPSANLFSRPSPTTAEHVLHDLRGRIDIVIDAGPTPVGVESTVLDLTTNPPSVLRHGAVTIEMLRGIVPGVSAVSPHTGRDGEMRSPGLLAKHYAPRTPMTLYEGAPDTAVERLIRDADELTRRGERVVIMAPSDDLTRIRQTFRQGDDEGITCIDLGPANDASAIASRLYSALRTADAEGADAILTRQLNTDAGLGRAIQDRLRRAAAVVSRSE